MATPVIMPQLGLTMTEGTVSKWFKAVGDPVTAGEVLLEISTDKITNQMEAAAGGVLLAVTVPEGTAVPVKTVLAYIGQPGERIETAAATAAIPAENSGEASETGITAAVAEAAPAAAAGGWVKASPLARRLAKENRLDLALVTATGPGGRVVERDIQFYVSSAPRTAVSPLAAKLAVEHEVDVSSLQKAGRIMAADVLAAAPQPVRTGTIRPAAGLRSQTPLAGMRKVIAERMSLSWQAPHVNMTVEADMTQAGALKERLAQTGEKISFTELVVKACALNLTEFPDMNAALIDGRVCVYDTVNIGVAVALDNGLMVPVIRDAQNKSLAALRREIAELGSQARQGALSPDAMNGGTFTVTNLGMYGIDQFTPVINPPESAILGVCRVAAKPVVREGQVAVRPMMNLCLSFDHRLIDGAVAARFLARLKALLEEPLLML